MLPDAPRLVVITWGNYMSYVNSAQIITYIPLGLISKRESKLSDGAFRLYDLLKAYSGSKGFCWYGVTKLAEELCVSTRHTSSLIKELKEHRLIAVARRGLTKTSIYFILDAKGRINANLDDCGSVLSETDRNFISDFERKHNSSLDKNKSSHQEGNHTSYKLESHELESINHVCETDLEIEQKPDSQLSPVYNQQ